MILKLLSKSSQPLSSMNPNNMYSCNFLIKLYQVSDWNQQENSRSLKHLADEMSGPLSPMSLPAPKQLKFTPGVVNGSVRESSATFLDDARKVCLLLFLWRWCFVFELSSNDLYSDDTHWRVVNKEASSRRTSRKTLEMEEKSSSMAATVQMEVAEALETLRMDQTQWWDNHEVQASSTSFD